MKFLFVRERLGASCEVTQATNSFLLSYKAQRFSEAKSVNCTLGLVSDLVDIYFQISSGLECYCVR